MKELEFAKLLINEMKELEFAKLLINEIKEKFLNGREIADKKIMDKGVMDVVTNLDREIKQYTVSRIRAKFPGDNILGEEYGGEMKGRAWVIDPHRRYVRATLPATALFTAFRWRLRLTAKRV